jgi:queuine tRNA-ribosyltransferase
LLYTKAFQDESSSARIGTLALSKGPVSTPVFMPVGTQGTVKGIHLNFLDEMGFKLILSNTYHLYLRPGMEVIESAGGLHNFSQWEHNYLTDSGGFQIFSLSALRKIKDEGVEFQSHIDGSKHFLSPEKVVRVQETLGSDIQMVLDVCTEHGISKNDAKNALEITTRWANRAKQKWLQTREDYTGKLFGIVQGNFFKDLRKESANQLIDLDLPGYALGGLSVGEEFSVFKDLLHYTAPLLPDDKPKYLMGIGTPEYILEAVDAGIDMFDCVFPTRVARNGTFFTDNGRLVIKNERYRFDQNPIAENSPIANYSRSYIRHLFKAGEMLGPMLATQHNLWYLKNLMDQIHLSIKENRFSQFKKSYLEQYNVGDIQ